MNLPTFDEVMAKKVTGRALTPLESVLLESPCHHTDIARKCFEGHVWAAMKELDAVKVELEKAKAALMAAANVMPRGQWKIIDRVRAKYVVDEIVSILEPVGREEKS